MRVDKFLWTIRLFKTRSLASRACNGDRIKINDAFAKSSKTLVVGDHIQVKTNPIWRSFQVLNFPKSRVGAKLVSDYLVEITSETDLNHLQEIQLMNRQNRTFGLKGRPTKKDRRDLDGFRED